MSVCEAICEYIRVSECVYIISCLLLDINNPCTDHSGSVEGVGQTSNLLLVSLLVVLEGLNSSPQQVDLGLVVGQLLVGLVELLTETGVLILEVCVSEGKRRKIIKTYVLKSLRFSNLNEK